MRSFESNFRDPPLYFQRSWQNFGEFFFPAGTNLERITTTWYYRNTLVAARYPDGTLRLAKHYERKEIFSNDKIAWSYLKDISAEVGLNVPDGNWIDEGQLFIRPILKGDQLSKALGDSTNPSRPKVVMRIYVEMLNRLRSKMSELHLIDGPLLKVATIFGDVGSVEIQKINATVEIGGQRIIFDLHPDNILVDSNNTLSLIDPL